MNEALDMNSYPLPKPFEAYDGAPLLALHALGDFVMLEVFATPMLALLKQAAHLAGEGFIDEVNLELIAISEGGVDTFVKQQAFEAAFDVSQWQVVEMPNPCHYVEAQTVYIREKLDAMEFCVRVTVDWGPNHYMVGRFEKAIPSD